MQQIAEVQRILLQQRKPDTPVAITKSASPRLQAIQMDNLDEMAYCEIGNGSTFRHKNPMVIGLKILCAQLYARIGEPFPARACNRLVCLC